MWAGHGRALPCNRHSARIDDLRTRCHRTRLHLINPLALFLSETAGDRVVDRALPSVPDPFMPPARYNTAEARARFSELLARAKAGEEIVIAKGGVSVARLLPPVGATEREPAPLKHLRLPDDLFDGDDPEQAALDAGNHNDGLRIWRGHPTTS